jgi:predicted transcriptional regulator
MNATITRKDLTQAQRRVVDSAFSKETKRVERPITAGFAVSAWERMMETLCKQGVFKPYPHGGEYELTDDGLKLGRTMSDER